MSKKNILIVYAHPNKLGHSGCFLKETISKLEEKKVNYEVLDLYEMNYSPVLTQEEYSPNESRSISAQNLEIQNKIKSSDLIFIFPTWWLSMPAILKGFFDRVLTKDFAFTFNDKGIPVGLLNDKKAVVFTSVGAPKFVNCFFYGNRNLKSITKDILGFCRVKTKGFYIGSAVKLNEENKEKIKNEVEKGLKYLISCSCNCGCGNKS